MNNKVKGGLYGLLVGDAIAVPYEFRNPKDMAQLRKIEMIPDTGYKRTYPQAKVGSWSDEGAMMLCMTNTLCNCHTFNPEYFMKQLVAYKKQGLYAVDHIPFGYSRHFEQVIKKYEEGGKMFHLSDALNNRDASTLVRTLPLAIYDLNEDAKSTIRLAHLQSMITHKHPLNGICAAIYMQWIKNILKNEKNAFVKACKSLMEMYNDDCRKLIIQDVLKHTHTNQVNDIVDILMDTYKIISSTSNYYDAVTTALRQGGQTTSLASAVGCIAGLMYGYEDIPSRWLDGLKSKEDLINPLFERFDSILEND